MAITYQLCVAAPGVVWRHDTVCGSVVGSHHRHLGGDIASLPRYNQPLVSPLVVNKDSAILIQQIYTHIIDNLPFFISFHFFAD